MQKNAILSIVAILVIIGGGVWIYKSNTATPKTPGTNQAIDSNTDRDIDISQPNTQVDSDKNEAGSASTAGTVDTQEVKTFTVQGSNFAFAPSTITVKKGDKVKIIFENTGGFHDLKIDEFSVATKRIQGEQKEVVEFIADKEGSFEYYCSVGTHRQMGMKGTLIVQ